MGLIHKEGSRFRVACLPPCMPQYYLYSNNSRKYKAGSS